MVKVKLHEIAEISAGQGAPQGASNYSSDGLPFVKAGDLSDLLQGNSLDSIQKVSQEVAGEYKLRIFPSGTVVFAKSGMSSLKGLVYTLPSESYVVNHLACIIPTDNISSYLEYYFRYKKPNELVRDYSYPSIRLSDISSIEIGLPSVKEIQKIVRILDLVSDMIRTQKDKVYHYDRLIISKFREMFDNLPLKYKFSEVIKDYTKFGYKFDSSNYELEGEIAIVDQGKEIICGYKNKEQNKNPYFEECIIFGDHTEIFKHINFPFYLGADGTKILSIQDGWNTRFVYEFLRINYKKIGGYSRHFKFLKNQLFFKPELNLQLKFEDFCSKIDEIKQTVEISLSETELLLNSLMQEYFG